jgi:hypothetical protein
MALSSQTKRLVLFQFKIISAIVATKVGGVEGVVKLQSTKHCLIMDFLRHKLISFTNSREVSAAILMSHASYAIATEVFQAEFQIDL